MFYSYSAKDKQGKLIRGTIEAQDQKSVSGLLREKNLFLVNLKTQSNGSALLQRKVSAKDKIIFSEQLAIMVRGGLPLVDALKSLREETENKRFAKQISQIISDVEGGAPLSKALSKHKNTFDDIYINLVKSGEQTGKVDIVLDRLTIQLQKDYELNRKVRGALNYPIFVLFVMVIVVIIILIFIIPQLKVIFDDAGIQLPVITRFIIALSLFLKKYVLFLALGTVGAIIVLSRWRKTNSGRHVFDALITKIPVIGNLLKKTYMSRFTRTFASLVSSGLPLLEVFKVSSGVIGNVYYEEEVNQMAVKVKNGQAVSVTLKESKLFPKIIGQLTAVGEKSGNTDEVFNSLADFFDRDIDNITANLSSMLEPVLMVIMGIAIGVVVISVLQPLYGLVNAI